MRKTKNLRRRAYNSSDRQLRERIFRLYADQTEGKILVEDMERIFIWIKSGGAPEKAAKPGPKLAVNNGK